MKPIINAPQRAFLDSLEDRLATDSDVVEIIEAAILVRNADANGVIRTSASLYGNGHHSHGRAALERLARAVDGACCK